MEHFPNDHKDHDNEHESSHKLYTMKEGIHPTAVQISRIWKSNQNI